MSALKEADRRSDISDNSDRGARLALWGTIEGLGVNVDLHSTARNSGPRAVRSVVQLVNQVEAPGTLEHTIAREAAVTAATKRFRGPQLMLLSYYRDQLERKANAILGDDHKKMAASIDRLDLSRNVPAWGDVFAEEDAQAPLMIELATLTEVPVVLHFVRNGKETHGARFEPNADEDVRRQSWPYVSSRAPLDPLHAFYNEVNGIAV